jgi:integrase
MQSHGNKRKHQGIEVRHSRSCRLRRGEGECNCKPAYLSSVYSSQEGKEIRKTFHSLAEAKAWRASGQGAVKRGTLKAPTKQTLNDAAEALIAGMRNGTIPTRSGDTYKPSAIRSYDQALTTRILPDLGARKLSDIQREDVKALAARLAEEGLSNSTIRNVLMPLRVIFREAIEDRIVSVTPFDQLRRLPRGRKEEERERVADPEEATKLLAALPEDDRAVWATALYAGLRRGELLALRWRDVDLAKGVVRVERSYDVKEHVFTDPKSKKGKRRVRLAPSLRDELAEHKERVMREAESWDGMEDRLVFGGGERPISPNALAVRAKEAWGKAKLNPIGLHECRHTCVTWWVKAGVNIKTVQTWAGHSSITITLDRYSKHLPDDDDAAGKQFDGWHELVNTQARLDQLAS